jgi:hypothetical protein
MISRIDIEDMMADQFERDMASEEVLVPGTYTTGASKSAEEVCAAILKAYDDLNALAPAPKEIRLHPIDIMRLRQLATDLDICYDTGPGYRHWLSDLPVVEDMDAPRLK